MIKYGIEIIGYGKCKTYVVKKIYAVNSSQGIARFKNEKQAMEYASTNKLDIIGIGDHYQMLKKYVEINRF